MSNRLKVAASSLLALLMGNAARSADDVLQLITQLPSPPKTMADAQNGTALATVGGNTVLKATAYVAFAGKISASTSAKLAGSIGGIDVARASSDPAYAAELQQRMQSMSMADRMAMAQQVTSQQTSNGTPAVAGFLATQRAADTAAQQKIRTLLEGALTQSGAQHRAIDAEATAAAKACAQDKTGWPLKSCTDEVGAKAIARHRDLETAVLPIEDTDFAQAVAIANAELAKGKDIAREAGGQLSPLAGWVGTYAQMLHDYGEAITVRAGFWTHAPASQFDGGVKSYVGSHDAPLFWPVSTPLIAHIGLE